MKKPVRTSGFDSYVGSSCRQDGYMPKPDDYYVTVRFRKDAEPDRLVIADITPSMIIQFLEAMPASVTDFVCERAQATAAATRELVAKHEREIREQLLNETSRRFLDRAGES